MMMIDSGAITNIYLAQGSLSGSAVAQCLVGLHSWFSTYNLIEGKLSFRFFRPFIAKSPPVQMTYGHFVQNVPN